MIPAVCENLEKLLGLMDGDAFRGVLARKAPISWRETSQSQLQKPDHLGFFHIPILKQLTKWSKPDSLLAPLEGQLLTSYLLIQHCPEKIQILKYMAVQ